MAKWYGKVGYIATTETEPGYYETCPVERQYYGDVLRNTSRWTPSGNLNDNVDVSNQISIVADPFAYQKFHEIKYVEFMGAMWDVTSIEVQHPRLILTVGGVYNGEQARSTE
jgi:hypothetical protein